LGDAHAHVHQRDTLVYGSDVHWQDTVYTVVVVASLRCFNCKDDMASKVPDRVVFFGRIIGFVVAGVGSENGGFQTEACFGPFGNKLTKAWPKS